jgi:hypothetical protein
MASDQPTQDASTIPEARPAPEAPAVPAPALAAALDKSELNEISPARVPDPAPPGAEPIATAFAAARRAVGRDPAAEPSLPLADASPTTAPGSLPAQPSPDTPARVGWDNLAPGQQVTLYRGEGGPLMDSAKDGLWWTSDPDKAAKFGEVKTLTLPSELIGRFAAQGHGGKDEFVFDVPPAEILEQQRKRKGDIATEALAPPQTQSAATTEQNEISRDYTLEPTLSVPVPAAPPKDAAPTTDQLPEFVRRHFVNSGNDFYHRQNPDKLAFQAKPDSFRAVDATASVATALVEMAQHRGWDAIKVKGTPEFRRLVYEAATERGMRVDGYTPTAGQKAAAEQPVVPPRTASTSHTTDKPPAVSDRPASAPRTEKAPATPPANPLSGALVAYGAAPYMDDPKGSKSYYVKLKTADGTERTHWGVDLERALGDSSAKVGEQVELERHGKQPVNVRVPTKTPDGKTAWIDKAVSREAWSVTRRELADPRPEPPSPTPPDAGAVAASAFIDQRLAHLPPERRQTLKEMVAAQRVQLEQEGKTAPDMPKPAATPTPKEPEPRTHEARER